MRGSAPMVVLAALWAIAPPACKRSAPPAPPAEAPAAGVAAPAPSMEDGAPPAPQQSHAPLEAAPAPATSAAAQAWVAHPQGAFDIMATEVTVAAFKACVDAQRCSAPNYDSCNYGKADKADHPMNCVDHRGAREFCAFAGGRLCTNEEWLAACSGDDGRPFPYGMTFDEARCNAKTSGAPGTWPVGSKADCVGGLAGVFDMAGNVNEWVDGCKGTYCKFRGGGFQSNAPELFASCARRCSGNQEDFRSPVIGVRCCRDRP